MERIKAALSCLLLVFAFSCADVWAQATAQISGTVKDQTGAVLPGVEVTATQTETGIQRTTITNETGSYTLQNLPLGLSRLEASLPGFRTYAQTGITLQVGSEPAIHIVLEVGQTAETIEVQANAAMVETRTVGVSQVIETARILELPLNGRNVESLIGLAGGAVFTGETSNRALGGQRYSVAGGVDFGVEYQLDGANHMNYTSSVGNVLPFPDALEEFNVRTSGLSADSGRAATVGAVTKSGTNQFHGSAFDFVRNDLFNAREYFAVRGSTLKRHQLGGTVGGPIRQNRVFFFAGYQQTTLRSDPSNLEAFVPTAAMLAGDWTTFASTRCRTRQITLAAPFAGNRIDPARFSPAAVNLAKKLPKTDDPCGRYQYGRRTVNNQGQGVTRIDYKQSDNHSLFGRYLFTANRTPAPWTPDSDNIILAGEIANNDLGQSAALGSTYLFGPNTVNVFRVAYNRIMIGRKGTEFFGYCDLGVKMYCGYMPKSTNITISGGFNLNQTSRPDDFLLTNSYDISNDLNLVRGNHQVSIGGGLNRTHHIAKSSSKASGEVMFTTTHTGAGLGDFMTGQVDHFEQGAPGKYEPVRWYPRAYVTEVWKLIPSLTMNVGVRWEPFIPEQKLDGSAYNFDYMRFQQGIKSSVFLNAPAGFYYPGDPGFPNGSAGVHKVWNQLSPRIGLAWDVTGDGRMSVRASYGLSYETDPLETLNRGSTAPPFGNRVELISPVGGFDDPWKDVPGGSPHPFVFDKNIPFGPYGLFHNQPYTKQSPRSSSWNLSLQRQLPAQSLLSLTYIGSIATHLDGQEAMNPAIYIPGGPCVLPDGRSYNPCSSSTTTNLRRKLNFERYKDGQYIGATVDRTGSAVQRYAGLLVSLRTRPTQGINVNTNYTWSHCVGDTFFGSSSGGAGADVSYHIPGNRHYDWGTCDTDRRQVLNLTSTLDSPQFERRMLRAVATGWKLAFIYKRSSGSPLSVGAGSDRALNGIASGQRANQILGNGYADRNAGPMEIYLNPDAFAVPALGTFGNHGRNSLAGPSTWDFDTALSRIFDIRESKKLEFRAEAYNLTNSFRPGNPGTSITSATFGQLRTSRAPRIMQFALKLTF
jgi:hypothetical protein